MDTLRAMQVFIHIADAGSLSAAARQLGHSLPAVVRSLAALTVILPFVFKQGVQRTLRPERPGLQALRNLHFQKLDMRLNYASNGAYRTESVLEGSNPDFYDGYPIRFSLNINGELPGLFRSALFSGDFNRHILEQLQSGKLQ